jgi:hypothetical protein
MRPTEGHDFTRQDPIEITILHTFIPFVFVGVKCGKVKPAMLLGLEKIFLFFLTN